MRKRTAHVKKQHREVKPIFKQHEDGKGDTKALLNLLADNLSAHMAIEQDIYYPAVKDINDDLVNESFEAHSLAEIGVKRLLAASKSDQAFDARVTAIKELIEHPVEEEQEALFPKVDRKLAKEQLEALGAKMKKRFTQAVKAGFAANVPKGVERTSAD